jgi:uncharacterized protein (DUF983 family)
MSESGMNEITLTHLPRHERRKANPVRRRAWLPAMLRGARGACPACGGGRLFAHGLKVADTCHHCGEELYHHRADRKGVALAAFVALQLVLLAALALQLFGAHPPAWVWAVPWLVAFVLLLRPVKGAVVGLQWALRLHGFQYAAMCHPRRRPRGK